MLTAIGDALQVRYAHGKLFAEFAAGTGPRQGELFAVSAGDINLASWQVRVRRQFNCQLSHVVLAALGGGHSTVTRPLPGNGEERSVACLAADLLAAAGQSCCPPAGSYLAVSGRFQWPPSGRSADEIVVLADAYGAPACARERRERGLTEAIDSAERSRIHVSGPEAVS